MLRVLALTIACGVLVWGQAVEPERMAQIGTPARVGVGITQRNLTLSDAIAMALENNIDIEIERTNRDTARENVEAARGFFDPAFRWTPLLQSTNTPTGSVLQGPGGKLTDRGLAQNFSFRQQLPQYGTAFNVDFDNSRQTTTNPFTSFNPLISTRLSVGFTQPLVRGFRNDRNRSELRIRQRRVDLSTSTLR